MTQQKNNQLSGMHWLNAGIPDSFFMIDRDRDFMTFIDEMLTTVDQKAVTPTFILIIYCRKVAFF